MHFDFYHILHAVCFLPCQLTRAKKGRLETRRVVTSRNRFPRGHSSRASHLHFDLKLDLERLDLDPRIDPCPLSSLPTMSGKNSNAAQSVAERRLRPIYGKKTCYVFLVKVILIII